MNDGRIELKVRNDMSNLIKNGICEGQWEVVGRELVQEGREFSVNNGEWLYIVFSFLDFFQGFSILIYASSCIYSSNNCKLTQQYTVGKMSICCFSVINFLFAMLFPDSRRVGL